MSEYEEWKNSKDGKVICNAFDIVTSDYTVRTQEIIKRRVKKVFECGQNNPSFETIKSAFAKLTPEQRVEITDDYCPYCGNKTPCSCMNDD